MSLPNGNFKKVNKSKSVIIKSFLSENIQPKWLHDNIVSLSHTYIHTYINPQTQYGYRATMQSYTAQQPHTGWDCKYIQVALLNLSMGDKHNDVVIFNTKNNKENMKKHTRNHVRAYSWYTYLHTYNN